MTELDVLDALRIIGEDIRAGLNGLIAMVWFLVGAVVSIYFFERSGIARYWLPLVLLGCSVVHGQDYIVIDATSPPTNSFEHHFANGVSTFSATNWSPCFGGSYRQGFAYSTTGNYAVKYVFQGLPAGKYRVMACWPNRSSVGTQRFSIIGAGPGVQTDVREVFINAATTAPSGYVISGINFGLLAEDVVQGPDLQLEVLTFDGTPNKNFFADAVALLRTGDLDIPPGGGGGGGGGGTPGEFELPDDSVVLPWVNNPNEVLGSHWTNAPDVVYGVPQNPEIDAWQLKIKRVRAFCSAVTFECGTWSATILGQAEIEDQETDEITYQRMRWDITVGRNGFAKVFWRPDEPFQVQTVRTDPSDPALGAALQSCIDQGLSLGRTWHNGEASLPNWEESDGILAFKWSNGYHPSYVAKVATFMVNLKDCVTNKTNWALVIPRCPDATFDPLAGTTVINGGEEVSIPTGSLPQHDFTGLPTGGQAATQNLPGWQKLFGWVPSEEIESEPFRYQIYHSDEYLPINYSINLEHLSELPFGQEIIEWRTWLRAALVVVVSVAFLGLVLQRFRR